MCCAAVAGWAPAPTPCRRPQTAVLATSAGPVSLARWCQRNGLRAETRCRSVPCRAVLQGSHSAAVCSLTPRPGRAARCRDPATAQIPPAPGRQPFCFASEEAPVPFQISLSLAIIVLQSMLPHSCPHASPMASSPLLPPPQARGASSRRLCPCSAQLFGVRSPASPVSPRSRDRLQEGGQQLSVPPPRSRTAAHAPRQRVPHPLLDHGSSGPAMGAHQLPPAPLPPAAPPGRVPSGVERSLTPLCCDEDPGHTMSSRGLAAPSKAEQV